MQEAIYLTLDSFLSRIKQRPYRIDRRIPFAALLGTLLRRILWLSRGLVKTTVLQLRPRAIFIASGVTFRNSAMCHFGKGVTLERGVIIDGLAEHGVVLGENVLIGPYSWIRSSTATHVGAGLQIGRNSSCEAFSYFGAGGLVTIGENVIMGQHVSFHAETHNHDRTDLPIRSQGITPQPITIEDDCWVGANVTFLGGAHVAHGSIVGAGAVVNKHYPPFSIIVGVPAKVVKSRLAKRVQTCA